MRLIIISNRLPLHIAGKGTKVKLVESAGGLATGLSSYLARAGHEKLTDYVWLGWQGEISRSTPAISQALKANKLHPLFLEKGVSDLFYNGFCNNTIWPLFHYFPSFASYDVDEWAAYKTANEAFHDELKKILKPDDIVWIHDYHLMLLPRLLRESHPDSAIGFFLHIPFPFFEIFRILPRKWREHILKGILGADVIGFHTYDYTRYFLDCVNRILGVNHTVGRIELDGRLLKVDTFPMGIDFQKFHSATLAPEVRSHMRHILSELNDQRVILSIDRLDYTKGILKRLEAFELFLEKHSEYSGNISLVLIVVPSRTDVELYQTMKQEIDGYVGKINGLYGTLVWTPIIYQYRSLLTDELNALYSISEVALVTPFRDGMNLVAKEYVASQRKKSGVLILSEMAGAAEELGEALIVNPRHSNEIADMLERALSMPNAERRHRMDSMQKRLSTYPVQRWADDLIDSLLDIKKCQREERRCSFLTAQDRSLLLKSFRLADNRLLLLDYDGTLTPLCDTPSQAVPDADLLALLKGLIPLKNTDIVLVSGRDRLTLDNWFGSLPLLRCAEHGVWITDEKDQAWRTLKPMQNEWKDSLRPILQDYTSRLPGSFIEEKEYSLAWHYRLASASLARARAKELSNTLTHFTANLNIQVIKGNNVMELRCSGADKGSVALHYLEQKNYDFVLALGDDTTDEDLFRVLPENAFSIKVGLPQNSAARFFVSSPAEARHCLEDLTKERPTPPI